MIVYNNRALRVIDKWLIKEGTNPLNLPAYTLRCMFEEGYTPTQGTSRVQVSSSPNVWDIYKEGPQWNSVFLDETHLVAVLGVNSTGVTSMSNLFSGCSNLRSVALFDTSSVTWMGGMFTGTRITSVPAYDTSNVMNMASMFSGCTHLKNVPLFDTSNVVNMQYMFNNCYSLKTVPLFDTSTAQVIRYMFYHCTSLETIPAFDFENVYDMYAFCSGCSSLTAIPALNVPSLNEAGAWYVFAECRKVESGALALYEQLSAYLHPYYNNYFFYLCGTDTETGRAEWLQIPVYWGGGNSNGNLY